MISKITPENALKFMIGLLILVILFHISIFIQIIPYTIVWAGKLNTVQEMWVFESVSISINILLITLLLLKGNYIKHTLSDKLLNLILWIFVLIFSLNSIGNLMSETILEKVIFTPLTLISAFLIWIIVKNKKVENSL
ncbi:MAG: hypothetical protein M3Q58_05665 [Bacteroidota bacterium]|nr:hypothetical protein [Bacteroidota bacterium]